MTEIEKLVIRRDSLLLVSGVFGPDDIETRLSDGYLSPHPEITSVIESNWAPKAAKGWKPLHLFHLNSFELQGNKLNIGFLRTNGKDFIGGSNWQTWKSHGLGLDLEQIPNVLVTSTVLITSDNKMMVQERGASAHQSGNIDALGGHIDPKSDVYNGRVDVFFSARRELMEETGLNPDEITSIQGLGLIYNFSDTSHYAMPFVARTPLKAQQVLSRIRDNEETQQVHLLPVDVEGYERNNPNHVTNIIRGRLPQVDPEARLTIALARRHQQQCSALNKQYFTRDAIIQTYDGWR